MAGDGAEAIKKQHRKSKPEPTAKETHRESIKLKQSVKSVSDSTPTAAKVKGGALESGKTKKNKNQTAQAEVNVTTKEDPITLVDKVRKQEKLNRKAEKERLEEDSRKRTQKSKSIPGSKTKESTALVAEESTEAVDTSSKTKWKAISPTSEKKMQTEKGKHSKKHTTLPGDFKAPSTSKDATKEKEKVQKNALIAGSERKVLQKVSTPSKSTKSHSRAPVKAAMMAGDATSDEERDGHEEEAEENVHLHGFSTDSDDSSEEEGLPMKTAPLPIEISKLPTIAKDDATVQRKLEQAERVNNEERGVIYLGRIPHGMYEDQLRGYFSQFGDVTRLRLSRNKKTGHSKAYAFIEFSSSTVARIVAETMHNYLLVGRILVCHVVPKDQVHPQLWVGANRRYRVVPKGRLVRVEHDRLRDDAQKAKVERRLLLRQERKKRKLSEAGLDYNLEAVAYKKTNTHKT